MSSTVEEEFSRAIDFYYDNSDESDHDDSLDHVESFTGAKDVPFEPVKKLFVELKKKFKINQLSDINKISKPEVVATYNKVNKGKKADIATIIQQVKQVSNVTSVVVMNNLETYQKMIGAVQKMQDQLQDLPKNKQISAAIDTFEHIKHYIQFFSDQSTKLVNLPPIQSDDDTDLTDTFRQLFFNLKEMLQYVNITDKKAAKVLNKKLHNVTNIDKVMNAILKSPLVIDSSKYTQSDIIKTLTDIYSYVLGNKNKKQLSELQNMMDKKLSGGKPPTFDTLGAELKKEQYLETLKIRTFRHQVIKFIINIHKEMSNYQLKHNNIWSLTVAIEQLSFIQQLLVSDTYYKDLQTIYDNIKDQYNTQNVEIHTIFSRLEHMIKLLQELEDTKRIQSAIKELKEFFHKIASTGYQQTLEDIINDDFEISQDELNQIFYDTNQQLKLLKNKIIVNQVKHNINRTHNELQTIEHDSYQQQNAQYIENLFNSTDKYFEDIAKFYQDDSVKWDPQLSKFIYHVLLRFQTSSEIMPIGNNNSKSDIMFTINNKDYDLTQSQYIRQAKMLAYVQKKSENLNNESGDYFWEIAGQWGLYKTYLNTNKEGREYGRLNSKIPIEFEENQKDMELCMDDDTLKEYLLPRIQIPFIQAFLHPNVMGRAAIKDSYKIEDDDIVPVAVPGEGGYNIHALGISALPPIIKFDKDQLGDKVFTKESLERLLDIYELYQSQIIGDDKLNLSNDVKVQYLNILTDNNVQNRLDKIINNQIVFWNINAQEVNPAQENERQYEYQRRTVLNDAYNYMLIVNVIIQQCINNGCINIYDPVLRQILLQCINYFGNKDNRFRNIELLKPLSNKDYPRICSKIELKEEYKDTIRIGENDVKVYNFKDFKRCLEESKLEHCIINNYLQVTEEDFEVLKVSMDKDDKDFKMRKYLSRCIYDQYRSNANIIEKNQTILKSPVEDDTGYDKSNFTQLLHKVIQLKKKGIFGLFSFMEKVEELLQQDLNKIHSQKIDLDQLYSLISQLMIKQSEPVLEDVTYKYVINKHKSLVKQGKSMNFMSKLTGKGAKFTEEYQYSVIEYYKELEKYIKNTMIEVRESVEIENFIGIVTSIAVSSDKQQKTLLHNTLKSYISDFLISNIIDVDTNILELPFEVTIHKQNEIIQDELKKYVEDKHHDYIKDNGILNHVTMQYSYKVGKDCSTKVIGTDSIFIPQLDKTYRYSNQSSLTAFANKLYNQVLSALCNRVINTLGFFKLYKKEAIDLEIKDISDFRVLTGAAKSRKSHKENKPHKDEIRDVELYYRVFLLCKWYQSFFFKQQNEAKDEAFLFIKPSSKDIRGEILQFVFKLSNDIEVAEGDRFDPYEYSHVKKFIQNVNKLQDMTKSANPQKVYDEIVKYVNTNYGIITKEEQREIKAIKDIQPEINPSNVQQKIKQLLIDDLQYSFMPFSKPTKGITSDDVHDLIKSQLVTLKNIYEEGVENNMEITNIVKHIHYQINNATSSEQKYQVIIDAFNKNQSVNQHFDLALQIHENVFFSQYVLDIINEILNKADNERTAEQLLKYNDGFLVKIVKHGDRYNLNTEQLEKHKTILQNYVDTHKKRIVSLFDGDGSHVYSSYKNIKDDVIEKLKEERKEEFKNVLVGIDPNKFRVYTGQEEAPAQEQQQQEVPVHQYDMRLVPLIEYIKNLQQQDGNKISENNNIPISQNEIADAEFSTIQKIPSKIQYAQIAYKKDRQNVNYYLQLIVDNKDYVEGEEANKEEIKKMLEFLKERDQNQYWGIIRQGGQNDLIYIYLKDFEHDENQQYTYRDLNKHFSYQGQQEIEQFKDRLLQNIKSQYIYINDILNDDGNVDEIETDKLNQKFKYLSMFNDIVEQLLDSTQTLMNSKQTLQYIFSGILESPDLRMQYLVKKVSDIYKALSKEITVKNLNEYIFSQDMKELREKEFKENNQQYYNQLNQLNELKQLSQIQFQNLHYNQIQKLNVFIRQHINNQLVNLQNQNIRNQLQQKLGDLDNYIQQLDQLIQQQQLTDNEKEQLFRRIKDYHINYLELAIQELEQLGYVMSKNEQENKQKYAQGENARLQYSDRVSQQSQYMQLIRELLNCNVLINTKFIDYGSNKVVELVLDERLKNLIKAKNTELIRDNKLESLFSSSVLLKMGQFINYRQQQENFGSKLEKNNEIFIVSQCVGASFQLKQLHQMLKLKIQMMSDQLQEVQVDNELEFYDYLQSIMYHVLNGFNHFTKNKYDSMTDFLHFSTLQQNKVYLSLFKSLIQKSNLTHRDNILYAKYLYNRVSGVKDIMSQMGHLIEDNHHFQMLEPLIFYIAQVNAKFDVEPAYVANDENLVIPHSQIDVRRFKKLVQAKFIKNQQIDGNDYDKYQKCNLIDIGIFPININMLKRQIGLFNIFLNSEMFEQKLIKEKRVEDPYNLPYSYHRMDVQKYAVTETQKIKIDLQERIRLLLEFIDANTQEQRESKYHNIFKLLSS